jgi:DNA-binding MarR family transcriptional regulator
MAVMAERDSIDLFLDEVRERFPEVADLEVEGAVDRIWKLSKHLDRLWGATASRFGLNKSGEYQVLLKIRHSPDGRSTPGDLAEHLVLSTGAMTNRLDRLEEAGLIVRDRDPDDRRSFIVTMTDRGKELFAEAVEAEAKEEQRLLGALRPDELRKLNALLRRLVLSFEREDA